MSLNIDLGYKQSRTLYRHKKEIRLFFQVTAFDKQARHLISESVSSSAEVMDNPADLINVAIEMLVKDRYELPGFNSLNRLVCRLRTRVNHQLFSQVTQQLDDQYLSRLDPNNSNDFVEYLKSWLDETAKQVDDGYPNNSQIVISEFGEPVLKRLKKKADNSSLKALESLIEERMPERNLIDILKNVDYWTNFTRHFGPLSGSDPKLQRATERYLLTLFTYGCNLGPYQAARHMRGLATAHELSFVNRRHINLSKLNAALVDILNRYHVLELPTFWGKGTSAAADGTKYDLYEQNLLSEYHIRYGGYGGIAYHHVADSYIALFSHFIPCGTWEAVYIIDGLLKNSSLIQPKTLHADTQGAECTAACDLECIRGRSADNQPQYLLSLICWVLN